MTIMTIILLMVYDKVTLTLYFKLSYNVLLVFILNENRKTILIMCYEKLHSIVK